MICVVLDQTGDNADAPDPESAVVTARTLMRDAYEANRAQGYLTSLTCTFYVGSKRIRQANYQTVLAAG